MEVYEDGASLRRGDDRFRDEGRNMKRRVVESFVGELMPFKARKKRRHYKWLGAFSTWMFIVWYVKVWTWVDGLDYGAECGFIYSNSRNQTREPLLR